MASKKLVLPTPSQLPNELFRDIVENLHSYRDRNTLSRLALVNKAWCDESQRALYRTVGDDATDSDNRESLVYAHTLFLETIILNPTRLGPYVQAYKQQELMCHPWSKVPYAVATSNLWHLTAEALPALFNLKHLSMVPLNDDPRTPRTSFFEGCTFKLKTLRWGFEVFTPSGTVHFVEFLRTQHDLLHLEVGVLSSRQTLSWLPNDVCARLISSSCRLSSSAHVMAKRKNIVGMKIWNNRDPQSYLSGLRHLKYLSISAHRDFMSHWGTIDWHTVLLELTVWHLETIQSLAGLSNLRVLALLRAPRDERPPYDRMGHTSMGVEAEYNLRMQLTTESFRRCPNLEHVIIEDIPRGEGPRRYRKMTMSTPNEGPEALPDIRSREFSFEHEPGTPWWTAYGV